MVVKKIKANGHIVQADWNQTDPLKMDYIHNKPEIPSIDGLASIEDLDKQQIKIVNRSGKVYSSRIAVKDLTWDPDAYYNSNGDQIWWGVSIAKIQLPDIVNDETIYIISLLNIPTVEELEHTAFYSGHGGGFGVILPPQLMELGRSYDDYEYWSENSDIKKGLVWASGNYNEPEITTQTITWTGPWYVACGESSGEGFELYKEFEDSIIEYSFIKEESDEEALGTIHSIDLFSNQQVNYDFAVEELTITNLVKSFPDNIAQEWSISFIAGDTDPIVTTPLEANGMSIKWLYAEPVFEANKKYLITFKQIIDTIYGTCTVLE